MTKHAKKLSSTSTQAVAAVLYQQFLRQRLTQEGIQADESFLQLEPNNLSGDLQEDLDFLRASLLQDDEDAAAKGDTSYEDEEPTCDRSSVYHSMIDTSRVSQKTNSNSNETILELNRKLKQLEANPVYKAYGRDLRRMAEEFEQHNLRKEVKEKAERVSFSEITRESFFDLLEQLFLCGVTREKIVILFFFCSDVALKAYKNAPSIITKLLTWSLTFILTRICAWVQQLGGWEVVLCSYFPSALHICLGIMGIFALGIFIKRSLTSITV